MDFGCIASRKRIFIIGINKKLKNQKIHELIYSNKNNPYDEFLISVEMDHIIISAPMPNSNMAYRSSVKTYWDASEYLQSHLENYIKNIKKPSALPKNKGYDSD